VTRMLAIGTDIVRVARLEKHAARPDSGFLHRSFTERELQVCGDRVSSLAGRWAAKESVMKALGAGLGEIPLTDIEIDRDADGRPVLHLHGEAALRAQQVGLNDWQVSISHDGDYAVAMVVASG
jgi:holo-[acyl-carrier protein] synthase